MLTLDHAGCLTTSVGDHGLAPESLALGSASAAEAARVTRDVAESRGTGWERWRGLPFDPLRAAHLTAVTHAAEARKGRFSNLLLLGIGGSALGAAAVHTALNPPTWNLLPESARPGPRLFTLDNVDPRLVASTLQYINRHGGGLEKTLVCVVSKSGETAETAAQFLLFRDLLIKTLGEKQHAENVVAITDERAGTMRAICDDAGYDTLPVPEGVGGRFSVLSPVGLFPAAMVGVDIDALLRGAAEMDDRCASESLADNPAAMLATLLVRLAREKGKPIHVLMPYANNLYALADWFRQLWAESLGKQKNTNGADVFEGFTPVKALGATDQHSQIQLYREGPNDKVVGFLDVESFEEDPVIPSGAGVEALAYLEGKSLGELLNAEKRATAYALGRSQRPHFTIRFPKVDAHHVGAFIQLWQVATAYAGRMLGVDAYDQPAVELGKRATFALMGREGYEALRDELS